MVSGKKFLNILKIKNSKFETIKELECYDRGELINICQLENDKILVFSNLNKIYIIEKKQNI